MKRTRLIVTAQTESVTKLKHAQQQRPLSRLCLSVLLFFSSGFAIRRTSRDFLDRFYRKLYTIPAAGPTVSKQWNGSHTMYFSAI